MTCFSYRKVGELRELRELRELSSLAETGCKVYLQLHGLAGICQVVQIVISEPEIFRQVTETILILAPRPVEIFRSVDPSAKQPTDTNRVEKT
jgi:hypothetical protein